ncbi:hypothetical protein E2C01_057911 [Portunus trituberculatus]|uniref:Uncharacterized protein n=1 Tax=Portunus trituberculatus TaxID=210409 RepID=A0A5B7H2D6_PORTR|nr:hypothetical protein [Portunus trituberculatus]
MKNADWFVCTAAIHGVCRRSVWITLVVSESRVEYFGKLKTNMKDMCSGERSCFFQHLCVNGNAGDVFSILQHLSSR